MDNKEIIKMDEEALQERRILITGAILRDCGVSEMTFKDFTDWVLEDGGYSCGFCHDHEDIAEQVVHAYYQLFSGGVFKGVK